MQTLFGTSFVKSFHLVCRMSAAISSPPSRRDGGDPRDADVRGRGDAPANLEGPKVLGDGARRCEDPQDDEVREDRAQDPADRAT